MKLKYYLRGLGIGILVTAVIMGVTQGSRKETLSDREIRERAAALGMVEPGNSLADLEAAETPAARRSPHGAAPVRCATNPAKGAHSIQRSARSCNSAGRSRPSARATLALTTSSMSRGCSTAMSAARAPRSSRSAMAAICR